MNPWQVIQKVISMKKRTNQLVLYHLKVHVWIGINKVSIFCILVEDTKDFLKSRHILGILGFLGFANVYAMRVNLSVAIVAMVNANSTIQPQNNSFDHCPVINGSNSSSTSVKNHRISLNLSNLRYL